LFSTDQCIALIQPNFSRERDIRLTDKTEMKALIGLLCVPGELRCNRQSLEELWGTDADGIEKFRLLMNQRCFKFLIRCIWFKGRRTSDERKKQDNLASVTDAFAAFVENCKKCYSLGQNVIFGEELEALRANYGPKQYIPSKLNEHGIKIYTLFDSNVLYTYRSYLQGSRSPRRRDRYVVPKRR
jgi:hypothetical protein